MFKWLNKQGVESDHGFIVQFTGRFTVEYREGRRRIEVYVEDGLTDGNKPCVIIDATAFSCWYGDPSFAVLPVEKQEEIKAHFIAAMEFQGLSVVVA